MTCSFSWSGKGFLPTGNQQLIRVFFRLELVIPLRQRLGITRCDLLTTFHFENLMKVLLFDTWMSFCPLVFLALSNNLTFLEPFKDSFSADRLMSFFLTLSSFSPLLDLTIRHGNVSFLECVPWTRFVVYETLECVYCKHCKNCAGMTNVTEPV